MSTPTPRTDYEEQRLDAWQAGERFVKSSLARNLETELSTAQARVAELEKDCLNNIEAHAKLSYQKNSEIDSLTRQLSESQAQLATIREANAVLQSLVDNADINLEQVRMAQKGLWRTKVESAESRIKELEAQLASAREDSARLDWLERQLNGSFLEIGHYEHRSQLNADDIEEWEKSGPFYVGQVSHTFGKTLRSAIDSARGHLAETPAGGETERKVICPLCNGWSEVGHCEVCQGNHYIPPPPQEKDTRE